jgi:hypothetical protein
MKEKDMDYLDIIKTSNLISNDDIEKLSAIKPQLLHAYTHSQVFRTRTEMEVSVLNDVKFPTSDSKYWQAVREQSVMFEELINLSFEYRKNNIKILKLERQLSNEEDDLEREMLQIEIEKKEFLKLSMERVARERIRELIEWQDIKDGLQIVCSPDDVNEHQLVSYTQRWINQLIAMGDNGSPPERWNLIGQLDKGIKECRKRGCLDKVYQAFDENIIQFLESNGIGREETECLPNMQKSHQQVAEKAL